MITHPYMAICRLFVICFASLVTIQSADRAPIGIVTEVRGKWVRVSDKKILEFMDELFPGTTVLTGRSESGSIRVALFDGSVWRQICTTSNPCEGSYAVKGAFSDKSAMPPDKRGLGAFVGTYFSAREHLPAIFTASRSAAAALPQESVVVAREGTIDLSFALSTIPTGRWKITLSDPSRPIQTGISAILTLPGTTMVSLAGLPNGILALDVQTESGGVLGTPVALLVVSGPFATTAQKEFANARQLTAQWEGVDTGTVHRFLVQALYAINELRSP